MSSPTPAPTSTNTTASPPPPSTSNANNTSPTPASPAPASPPPPDTSPPPPAAASPPPPAAASPPPPVAASPPPTAAASPPPPLTKSSSPPPPLDTSSPPPPADSTSPPPPASSPPAAKNYSPPPPPRNLYASPPPPSNSTQSSSPSSAVSTGLIAGVAIGGAVLIAFLCLVFICCRKKRRRVPEPVYYYAPPPPGPKDGHYGGQPQQWQHNAPPPEVYAVTMTPQPSLPPPPASLSSSGGSGPNYSRSENPLPSPSHGPSLGFSQSTFTYQELAMATDGFSDANILGQGGFGYVHKGVLPNGKEVAIKSLKANSGQGEREFQAEVETISRVHHKHLVSLVGYCMAGSQRMLVYEFVPNYTLEFHLHGKGRPVMDWPTRLKIALGSAKGLAYLHEDCHPKIIHRDIKAANVLLDLNFEAKVADFGLAKFSSDTNTHVSTRVMGTFGYLAPEYAASGKLSDKSDVFSYGVMLLELITGRRPVDSDNTFMDDSLVDWARPLLTRALEDGNYDTLVDSRLQKNYDTTEMACMVACAAACVRHSARRRPRLSQVVRALEGDASLSDLNEGVRPGHSTVYGSYGGSEYDTSQYNEDMKKFRKMALGGSSQEYGGSSEYSGPPTSEYGVYPSGSSGEGHPTTHDGR